MSYRRPRRDATQQLIIPPGLVRPDEYAVVEIPKRHARQPVVVAKPQTTLTAQHRASEYFAETLDNNSYERNFNVGGPSVAQTQYGWTHNQRTPVMSSQYSKNATYTEPPVGQIFYGGNTSYPATSACKQAPHSCQSPMVAASLGTSLQSTATCGTTTTANFSGASNLNSDGQLYPIQPIVLDNSQIQQTCSLNFSKQKKRIPKSQRSPTQLDLEQKEKIEKQRLQNSLENFQMARRKFLKEAIFLAGKMAAASEDDDSDSD